MPFYPSPSCAHTHKYGGICFTCTLLLQDLLTVNRTLSLLPCQTADAQKVRQSKEASVSLCEKVNCVAFKILPIFFLLLKCLERMESGVRVPVEATLVVYVTCHRIVTECRLHSSW
ncbi:hypothetical protein XENOCAPTIV_011676 [Xenoophorus captivus]|uniref:Uncharacterized protein n=1 Tax=Xenoophorus captivus TaxID=1517983 RepID=A0ABV0RLD8_9TELE